MKASLKWLGKYLDLSKYTPEEIASKLTFAGIEVDSINRLAKGTNLVIGEILSCENHPDSDHLHILSVNEGKEYGVHQIVCGAPNARKGLKVIVAREGAVLPEVTIVKSQIRGIDSDGMCCSLLELGVDKKFLSEKQVSGIEELPSDAPVGETDVLGYLGLDDVVLELELLANRGDLLSVWNIARELSAILDTPYKLEEFKAVPVKESSFHLGSQTEKCKIFHGALLKGIRIKESPKYIKEALLSSGIRPINNVVDIGNYVMLLTGEPVNMYDYSSIKNEELVVKDDYEGEFVTLDEKRFELKKGDLVVCDANAPLCLAGIMTSKEASITENTKDVLVECALFDGASIRRTSSRLGLSSDSSSRFVKGVSPEIQKTALTAIVSLLEEEAEPAEIYSISPYDEYEHKDTVIETDVGYINKRLGTSFDKGAILDVLRRDHVEIKDLEGDKFVAKVPSFRMDLKAKEDLSEETIRLLGYQNIVSTLPTLPLNGAGGLNEKQKAVRSIRHFLRDNGLYETITYSLRSETDVLSFEELGKYEHYSIKNPLTEERKCLRTSLLSSLLDVAIYNSSRQEKDFGIFEVSDVDALSYQGKRLAIVLSGEEKISGELSKRPYDFYSAKGYVDAILSLLKLSPNRFRHDTNLGEEFHPYRAERLLLGKKAVAVYGELHPTYKDKIGLSKAPIAVVELDLDEILALKSSPDKASIPSRFPSVTRDIAFLCDESISYENIKSAISKLDKRIEKVAIFDLYQGDKIEAGKKSIALHITMRKEEGTLLEAETKEMMDKAINALRSQFLAEVRS